MLLWTAFALMTGAAILAVLWPLRARAVGPAAPDAAADLAVYRDQLSEIERDRASGLIGEAEGEAARTEIARRMLRAADETAPVPDGSDTRRRAAAVVALVGVPLIAGGLYLALGSPELEGQPLAARLDARPEQADIAVLLRKVEGHLESNPDDGRGHEVVAPIYYRLGRVDDAARAWSNAIRLLGPNAARETGLGEALTAAAGGVVTADARQAFARAVAADPDSVKARYYLGLAAEQDGRKDEAGAIWGKLAADSPPDAPWLPTVRAGLERVGAPLPPVAAPAMPGPGAADVAAARDMTPEQRATMIRGMVEGLAQRLAQNGDDLDGWLRLVRAWSVLGEADKAKAAAGDARRHFADDAKATGRIDALTQELGLGS
ncbi:c-type cytochrome biogenesis protein CcmI [Bosea sp. 117]|uniref:c-type cytochrome biogenesis protein CcmI n=1 Tax=Bosea sp. 117 TaxID=1125973 RepID=UPI0004940566|nr:c-type cytochrome biogenesis protein CcmI [Bosea sp. 117]